jgi:hypothetical protein
LSGRPVLNLRSGRFDPEIVTAFLEGNYKDARKIDVKKYDIRNVAGQFLEKSMN